MVYTTNSLIDPSLPPLTPSFEPNTPNPPAADTIIKSLQLIPHIEGGHFVENDRSPARVPSPFKIPNSTTSRSTTESTESDTRAASTSIFYLLSPSSPTGHFHTNRARTVHTLHKGRGRYVLLHPAEEKGGKARVETFVVGQDVAKGERLQWVVDGGLWKGTFLLPDEDGGQTGHGESREGLLISETVVPGFEYEDHDFLTRERLEGLVSGEQAVELGWLVRRDG